MTTETRPDQIDKMVYSNTMQVRNTYYEACMRLGLSCTNLTPVTLMQRSVPE